MPITRIEVHHININVGDCTLILCDDSASPQITDAEFTSKFLDSANPTRLYDPGNYVNPKENVSASS